MNTKSINSVNNSKFVNVLTEHVNIKQNSLYTPLLRIAWEELKTTLNSPILKIESEVFNKINDYRFSKVPLSPTEIKKHVTIDDDKIKIEVEFDKSLPFKEELYINESPLLFEKKEICSFSPKKAWCNLLYYENEDDFAISISTKSVDDEIVLIKRNFENNFNLQNEIISVFSKKKDNNVRINREDTIIIPIIDVNNSSDYSDLLPVQLYTEKYPFIIEELKQKVNFKLNNKGAEVKAQLFMGGTLNCTPNEPKVLEFNKPFIVILKKVNNNEPYLAMYFANTEYLKEYNEKYIEKTNKEIYNKQPKLSSSSIRRKLKMR